MTKSLIRTVVPTIVAATVTVAARLHVHVSADDVTPYVVAAIGSAYYTTIRAAEARWPRLGWLLGSAGSPTYVTAETTDATISH